MRSPGMNFCPSYLISTGGGRGQADLYRSKGCFRCSHTGFKGRVGVYELLTMNEEIRRLILQRASTAEINKAAVSTGMVTSDRTGSAK